jgi:hypothetical protein
MRPRTATAVCTAGLSVAAVAVAAEPVNLVWSAPSGCPSREAVLVDVQRILGTTTSHHATARADVTHVGPDHWSLHLSTEEDGAPGERTLEANSCTSLATAAALILAWTVDPEKARAAAPTDSAAATTPEVGREHEAPPSPPARPAEATRVIVAASGVGDVGTLPSSAAAAEITVGALFGPLRAELSAADWATQGVTDADRPNEGTSIHLIEGALRGCFRGRLAERLEVDPCVGAVLVDASSNGFRSGSGSASGGSTFEPHQDSSLWSAMRGDVLAVWRLVGPLHVRASAGIDVHFARPRFVLLVQQPGQPQGTDVLHQPPLLTGRGTLGIEVRFP